MTEDKRQTSIYISIDIIHFCRKYKLNLSEWICTEFTKQFLSLDSKRKQLEDLQKEIGEIAIRVDTLKKSLTERELRYINQVMARVKEGKEITAMWRLFNSEYGRDFSYEEFLELVRFYESQSVLRVKKAVEDSKYERNHNR